MTALGSWAPEATGQVAGAARREAIELLAARAPTLAEAMKTATAKACVILDGTLLPIDKITVETPYYSGKHKRHDMNV